MSSRRPQHSAEPGIRRVVLAGADSPVGAALSRALEPVCQVVTVASDTLDAPCVEVLRGANVLVWAAHTGDLARHGASRPGPRRAEIQCRARSAVLSAAAAGLDHLVVVTSAMVYGAREDNPVPLPEDAPLRTELDDGLVGDLLAVEEVLTAARSDHPDLIVTSVRPAALAGPGVDTMITRHFQAPRLLVAKGRSTQWQFCHLEDLGSAVATVIRDRLAPVVAVAAPGALTQEQVETLSGLRRVEIAEPVALRTAARLHRVGVLPAPAADLAYAIHPWVVDPSRLADHGWVAGFDNLTAFEALLDAGRGRHAVGGRRLDRKEAALGAASAAVALVGTAALLRQARGRRS